MSSSTIKPKPLPGKHDRDFKKRRETQQTSQRGILHDSNHSDGSEQDGFTTVQSKKAAQKSARGITDSRRYALEATRVTSGAGSKLSGAVQEMCWHDGMTTGLKPSDFQLGEVVAAPHIVPNLDSGASGKEFFPCYLGPLCGKLRPHIIVAKFSDSLLAIPAYKHGGRGVSNKSAVVAENAFFLKQSTTPQYKIKSLEGVSPDRILNVTHNPRDGALIYTTKITTLEYAYPMGKIGLGMLDDPSRDRLLREVSLRLRLGQRDISKQAEELRRWRGVDELNDATADLSIW